MGSDNSYFRVRAVLVDDSNRVVYLINDYVGCSATIGEWNWASSHGTRFWSERCAKSRLRANIVRNFRATGFWKVQIVRCYGTDETVIWPKEDIPVLDRLAAL